MSIYVAVVPLSNVPPTGKFKVKIDPVGNSIYKVSVTVKASMVSKKNLKVYCKFTLKGKLLLVIVNLELIISFGIIPVT